MLLVRQATEIALTEVTVNSAPSPPAASGETHVNANIHPLLSIHIYTDWFDRIAVWCCRKTAV